MRLFEYSLESARSAPSEIALTPSANASATGTSRISNPDSRSQRTRPAPATSTQTAASFGARIESSTSMWMNWLGIISIRTSQPSSSIQPASCWAAGASVRSSPLPITIRPGSTMITSPPSSAPAVIIRWIGMPASW